MAHPERVGTQRIIDTAASLGFRSAPVQGIDPVKAVLLAAGFVVS
jgi:hypothetical protein